MQKKGLYITLLRVLGGILISSVVTLSIGYYLGDRGFYWFPDTVGILLICLFLGISCLLGSAIAGGVTKITDNGIALRKRIIFLCIVLIFIVASFWPTYRLRYNTPLAKLSPEQFQSMVSSHLELLETYDKEMDALLKLMQSNTDLFTSPDRSLSASEEQFLRQCWLALYDYVFSIDQIRTLYRNWYRFDISRSQRARHVQSFLLLYAADVISYEKALRVITLINQNSNAVTFLNAPHPDTDIKPESFSRLKKQLFGSDCHTRIVSGKAYLQWLQQGLQARTQEYSVACLPLWDTIESRLAVLDQMDVIDRGKVILDADFEHLRRGVSHVWFPAQKGVAEWMGDTRLHRVGRYLITPELQDELNNQLEPGDIMLSRKNWYLSNVGLPGFWPHAILYIGDPEKLNAYFDAPQVNAYLQTLTGKETTFAGYMSQQYPQKWLHYSAGTGQSDYHVIEAIKYGVVLNPLSKACGDYMAAIRPKLDKAAKAQAIIEAFKHLDKPYDFNFDFATDHALVCTELVWRSYRPAANKKGLTIDLVEMAGRKTLPANEIAKSFVAEKQNDKQQFEFVCFIDANEKDEQAHFSDEDTFIESVERAKWSFLQE